MFSFLSMRCLRAVAATSVLVVAACEEAVEAPVASLPRPVIFVEVASAADIEDRSFPARIAALQTVELGFRVPGQIEAIAVIEAQAIEQGDLIARLDQRDFISNVASAQAQYGSAESEYQRAVTLIEHDAISRSVVEQRRSARDVAEAGLQSAQDALIDTELKAPFSGVVAQVAADAFQIIQASAPIITLQSDGDMEAVVNIPSSLVARSASRELTGAQVRFDDAPGVEVAAQLREFSLITGSGSQTYEAKFTFTPPPDDVVLVLPGMNATLELESTGNAANIMTIPTSAVSSAEGQTFVWVIDTDTMVVARRVITLAQTVGETVQVTDGLSPGETIAGAGASHISEGMVVRPWSQ